MSDGMLSLSWNNHKATFCHVLSTLREKEKYTDVTVACEGRFYPVHKLVLSTCSEYFEKIFDNTPCKHPVIVLKDIAWDELEALLSYMYDGVVSVAQNDLARLIKAAEVLRIKGLAVPDEPPPTRNDVSSRKSTFRSSDDRSSPHPKRRKREENAPQSSVYRSPSSSPIRASPGLSESEPNRTQTDTRWKDHMSEQSSDRPLDDRLHQSASATSSSPKAPVEVMVDESLVKEEVEDTVDNRDDVIDAGMDYGSLGSDSKLDGSVGDEDGQMLPNKFEQNISSQSESQSQPLPDAVVEALAGPSGMQGWLGGCDVPGSFSGMEGYSGDGSQDVHPPQQGPPVSGVQSGAHQMIGLESDPRWPYEVDPVAVGVGAPPPGLKVHQCCYCPYSTRKASSLRAHMFIHTGEKPFSCPFCGYRSTQLTNLKAHVRKHTGEKPFACTLCSYRTGRKSNLNSHMITHKSSE
ncbi:zinc finger and BTB domain-containing protein 14-like isoform X36 [Macrobrachium nipponense]|uniref:zinc finger and BTB domain-containing protein 14-like isoform X36 n=1 Tax=Macrobrachium nipponense TaxID=159736 RepID=UPI0030C8AFC3